MGDADEGFEAGKVARREADGIGRGSTESEGFDSCRDDRGSRCFQLTSRGVVVVIRVIGGVGGGSDVRDDGGRHGELAEGGEEGFSRSSETQDAADGGEVLQSGNDVGEEVVVEIGGDEEGERGEECGPRRLCHVFDRDE